MKRNIKILIVDDDPQILFATSRVLKSAGYEVIEAATGNDGVRLATEMMPELVLLDFGLPDIDGFEVCRRIKEDPKLARIYVMMASSSNTESDHQVEGLKIGADGYLLRPIPNRELLARVQSILRLKQTEDELRLNEEYLDNILKSMADMLIVINRDATIRTINQAALDLLGYKEQELIGQDMETIFTDSDEEQGLFYGKGTHTIKIQNLIAQELVQNIETICLSKNGEKIPVVFSGSVMRDSDDQIQGIVCIVHDITKRKRMETQLRRAQKMEAIGVLTGGIAHEFNNLLSPILGYAQLLIEEKSEDDPDLEHLKQIQIAGNRATELVRQMLAYGRQSMSKKETIELESVIEDTVILLKNTISRNIAIKKEIEVGLPSMYGMPSEIHQVVLNLCINASHAMPEGGHLTIRLENGGFYRFINSEGDPLEGNFIKLCVQDTGVGMDQETIERIFDPFFTTKEVGQGSGLGLSVVQGIVEQHQGHIEIKSQLGSGTSFYVYFPSVQKEVQASAVKMKSLSKGNERILLIDDEQMITGLTQLMLNKLGYKVTAFLDSTEALQMFTNHPDDFDLIMTDYGMPKMNGKELGTKMKEIRPEIPIILFTGYGDLIAKEDIHTWGMDEMLVKPLKLKELSEVVRQVLEASS